MRRVLVTGAAGCLGTALCRQLAEAGDAVRGLGRSTMPPSPHAALEWREADLVTADLRPVVADCQAVVHAAALVHRPEVRDAAAYRQQNVQATLRLLDAANSAGIAPQQFVFISSTAVYGRDHNFHGDETTPCQPNTPYGQSKLDAERLVLERGGVVLRLPLMYGPGDRGNMARLIHAIARGRFVLPGRCQQPRSMVSSANAAAAVRAALDGVAGQQTFLITDDRDLTVRQLAELIRGAIPRPPAIRTVPLPLLWPVAAAGSLASRAGLPAPITLATLRKLTGRLTFSCEKAKAQLGYRPIVAPPEAIPQAVRDALGATGNNAGQGG